MFRIQVLFIVFIFSLSSYALGQIKLDRLLNDRVDLSKLEVTKDSFFAFIARDIAAKPIGYRSYSQVAFDACDYPYKEKALKLYRDPKGKELKYLSNPTCEQTILHKVLRASYRYEMKKLSSYRHRQCLLNLSKIIDPILVLYALQIEEPTKGPCSYCNSMMKHRAKSVFKAQEQINKFCGKEAGKTAKFIMDLSEVVEGAMRTKSQSKF